MGPTTDRRHVLDAPLSKAVRAGIVSGQTALAESGAVLREPVSRRSRGGCSKGASRPFSEDARPARRAAAASCRRAARSTIAGPRRGGAPWRRPNGYSLRLGIEFQVENRLDKLVGAIMSDGHEGPTLQAGPTESLPRNDVPPWRRNVRTTEARRFFAGDNYGASNVSSEMTESTQSWGKTAGRAALRQRPRSPAQRRRPSPWTRAPRPRSGGRWQGSRRCLRRGLQRQQEGAT